MNFEDRLREHFRRADASVPGERIDWSTTITKARRSRMRFAALTAAAAVSILGVGAYAINNTDNNATVPIGSAGAGAPSSEPTPEPIPSENVQVRGDCSASDSEVSGSDWDAAAFPDAVAEMRNKIIVAAVACDYDELENLALGGREGFGFSFGGETDPSEFWRDREREAKESGAQFSEYMHYLVSILELPHCTDQLPNGDFYYIWPRAHCENRSAADWEDLEGLYNQKQIEEFRSMDLYYGFRIGILEDGDWQYFNTGD